MFFFFCFRLLLIFVFVRVQNAAQIPRSFFLGVAFWCFFCVARRAGSTLVYINYIYCVTFTLADLLAILNYTM